MLKVLIRTNFDTNRQLMEQNFQSENLLIIDSYELIVKSKLEEEKPQLSFFK